MYRNRALYAQDAPYIAFQDYFLVIRKYSSIGFS